MEEEQQIVVMTCYNDCDYDRDWETHGVYDSFEEAQDAARELIEERMSISDPRDFGADIPAITFILRDEYNIVYKRSSKCPKK